MKYNKLLISAVSITAAVTLLAGCAAAGSGKSGKKDKQPDNDVTYEACETTVAMADDSYYLTDDAGVSYANSSYKSGDYAYDDVELEYDSYEYTEDLSYENGSSSDSNGKVLDPETERLLIRTVSMDVKTTTYDVLCNNVTSKINEYGGYIEYLSATGTGEPDDLRYAYYTIRVPAENLDALIESLDGNCTVVSKSESTSDVTLDYVDTQSYLEALQIEQEQLMEMLDQATDLDTILVLQSELTDVRYEIEYAESCLRVMENQVSYATLNLSVTEITDKAAQEEEEEKLKEQEEEAKPEPTYAEQIAETFNESLENVKEFFKEAFLELVSVSIVLVPILVIVIIAVIIICVKISKYKKAKKAAAKKEEEDKVKKE